LLAATGLAALPAPAAAQSDDTLPPTVVVGRQIEEKLSTELAEYGHQVVVIQGEDIVKYGYSDLNEALAKMAPGFSIGTKSRADYARYFMNGGNQILFLIDGVRVNNRLFGSGYMDTLGAHQVERVEILYGGEGLFYGTEATNGVVNIVTKRPTQEVTGQVGVAYGSRNFYDAYWHLGFGSGRHRFLAAASYDTWDGYQPFPDYAYLVAKNYEPVKRGYERLNISLKYETELYLAGHNMFSLSLFRSSGEFGNHSPANHDQFNEREEYVGIAKWEHDVSPNYSYYVKAYLHTWWSDYTQVYRDHTVNPNADKVKWGFEDWGINFLNSFRSDRGDELIVGLDFQSYWGQDYWYKIKAIHEKVYAVFAQFRPYFSFWEDWKVAIGGRYNRADAADSFIWNVSSKMPFLDEDRLYLRFNVGTTFLLPTAEQLFVDQPTGPLYGNPDLKPQRSFTANAALGSSSPLYDIEVGGFYDRTTDKFGTDTTGKYQNIAGRSITYGFSVTGALRPVDGLTLSASYTRNYYESVSPNGSKTTVLNYLPRALAKLGVQYDGSLDGREFGFGVFATWTGKTYQQIAGFTSPPASRLFQYGDYWLVDANLYVKPTENWRVTLSLANIFDKQHAPFQLASIADPDSAGGRYVYPAPQGAPFTATLGVSYTF
jgi:outer membrane cobalamin receptor